MEMANRNKNRYKSHSDPLVSVVLPTFNRRNWLPIALNSLVNQTYTNIEILVVNDCGVDVKDIVESYDDNRIKYFSHNKNSGLAASRNTAMSKATGDYFCWLDDDDFYLPLAIEFRMSQIKKRNAEIVYTRALKNVLEPVGDGNYKLAYQLLYWDSDFNVDKILLMNIAPCLCPLFSRKAWDIAGNYKLDETMSTSEDHDFWVALSRKNHFEELKIVDAECTFRNEKNGQMTGSLDFSKNWITIFKRWRHTAKDMKWVVENQNNILRNVGINPEDHSL
jgi:glycosyltransferase involved in cell wall biosynthesis